MRIALLGYGKMGKTIEQIALQRGHTIVIKAKHNDKYDISQAEIAIDFSVPKAAFKNISHCLTHNVPVISGTTGWLNDYDKAIALCHEKKGAFIYASNFSIGVNVFFELNRTLAKMMNTLKEYKVSIEEIHHTQKLDTPSGTAITIASDIIKEHANYSSWSIDEQADNILRISAKRIEDIPGTHSINYSSDVDTININHIAHSRQGFALGAIIAAEWLSGKTGVFTMKDVLNIG